MKIFILLKRNIFTLIFGFFLISLVLFSNKNLSAAKDGVNLWWTCVVPSLFPFFIATELLNYTNIIKIFGRLFSPIMRPLFNLPGEAAYAVLMGIISGSPIGAKVTSDIYSSNNCTKEEAERMLAFTNNSGPLFIIGTVGVLMFRNSTIGFLLLITHILSAFTVGIILGQYSKIKKRMLRSIEIAKKPRSELTISTLGDALSSSITKSITLILQIGGFIVLFSVILSMLENLKIVNAISNILNIMHIPSTYVPGLFNGTIELTTGVHSVSLLTTKKISYSIATSAFIIGFGGISIAMQVLSIVSKYKLSIRSYFRGKIMQAFIASFYVLLFIKIFPIFNLDLP